VVPLKNASQFAAIWATADAVDAAATDAVGAAVEAV
jgi:hypothetical protein